MWKIYLAAIAMVAGLSIAYASSPHGREERKDGVADWSSWGVDTDRRKGGADEDSEWGAGEDKGDGWECWESEEGGEEEGEWE